MKPIYEEIEVLNEIVIKATYPDGLLKFIPLDPANADYQAYLRWLENPDAELGATL